MACDSFFCYPEKFKNGDIAIPKIRINFSNEIHEVGDRIVVTEETEAYFNVNFRDYENEAWRKFRDRSSIGD
jgi:hypothetical protein